MGSSLDHAGEFARLAAPVGPEGLELLHARFWTHRFAPHMHETWAIAAVITGQKDNVIGGRPNLAHAGQILALRPHQVHGGRVVGNEPCEYVMAYVPKRLLSDWAQRAGVAPILPEDARFDPGLVQQFATLVAECRSGASSSEGKGTELDRWSALFVDLLKRHGVSAAATVATPKWGADPRMHEAIEYLNLHWNEHVSVEDLAHRLDLTAAHFCRLFSRTFGLPPHRYQTVLRVMRAKSLLKTGVQISEVAASSGFADQSHLGRMFKACYGVTPGEIAGMTRAR
ncbi:AraC family transcriptional regulator [Paraburkholderia sp. SIMBA_055]|nr:AraC family transcriptional regulator [bacterium M00.F.Ca.ET.228.01.1.1]TGR95307.1 AraC family transcriptional regulator [bacterium M00.F.Ca.ET.191.01.1.1]TGT96160.1 AraC family transcriptional regulator [bacterium M00.F.Ca.ET.155.01.1.1]